MSGKEDALLNWLSKEWNWDAGPLDEAVRPSVERLSACVREIESALENVTRDISAAGAQCAIIEIGKSSHWWLGAPGILKLEWQDTGEDVPPIAQVDLPALIAEEVGRYGCESAIDFYRGWADAFRECARLFDAEAAKIKTP